MPSGCATNVAIIAGGKVPYAGSVDDGARPHPAAGAAGDAQHATARGARRCRESARREGDFWDFPLPESGVEPLLRALIEGEAGILSLSIERAGLHDAFVAIAGEAARARHGDARPQETLR